MHIALLAISNGPLIFFVEAKLSLSSVFTFTAWNVRNMSIFENWKKNIFEFVTDLNIFEDFRGNGLCDNYWRYEGDFHAIGGM